MDGFVIGLKNKLGIRGSDTFFGYLDKIQKIIGQMVSVQICHKTTSLENWVSPLKP